MRPRLGRSTRRGVAGLLLLCLAAVGCASGLGRGASSEDGERPVIRVSVLNQIVGGSTASVYIVPEEAGGRHLLGTVAPDDTASFTYRPMALPETYRLLAEFTGGQNLVSNPFTAAGSVVVGWRTEHNSITVKKAAR